MPQYNTASDFLIAVQNEIKWKRAKNIATQEIADHITDQCDTLREHGMSEAEALEKTLSDLGNAQEIGKRLNTLHRPKINWLLIGFTLVLLCAGAALSVLVSNSDPLPLLISIIVGLAAMSGIYWVDYTILIRYPKTLYFILLLITIGVLIYDMRNGLGLLAYNYSYYPLLLFPMLQICIAFQLKERHKDSGLLLLVVFFIPPLFIAFLISSVPAIIYLFISDAFLVGCAVKNRWFVTKRISIIGILACVAVIAIGLSFINLWTDMWHNFLNNQGSYLSANARELIRSAPFFGQSHSSADLFSGTQEYILLRLILRYGNIVLGAAVIIYGLILYLMYRIVARQTAYIGTLLSYVVLICFATQFLLAFIGNLGLINGQYIMPLPFIASGGIYTVFNLVLIGVMLSVCRYEDIAKDWIKLKNKKTTERHKHEQST